MSAILFRTYSLSLRLPMVLLTRTWLQTLLPRYSHQKHVSSMAFRLRLKTYIVKHIHCSLIRTFAILLRKVGYYKLLKPFHVYKRRRIGLYNGAKENTRLLLKDVSLL